MDDSQQTFAWRGTILVMKLAQIMTNPVIRLTGLVLVVAGLFAVASVINGRAPEPADAGLSKTPPPLALPSDTSDDSPVAKGAVLLQTGQTEKARDIFIDEVAKNPDDVVAQTGLMLSGWKSLGGRRVERDLAQLARENPEDAYPALHLGLVQALLGTSRVSRESLRTARELGWAESDNPTSQRMAVLADDVLHPDMFRGYVPILVKVSSIPKEQRAKARAIIQAVAKNQRGRARELAGSLQNLENSAPTAIVAAIATYSKDAPLDTAERIDKVAVNASNSDERDLAILHAALVRLWDGKASEVENNHETQCAKLSQLAASGSDTAAEFAKPIHSEICV